MAKTILRAPAAIACSFALAASLAVPTALASSGAYGDDVDDIIYVDEDEDGYDDNTDEWIGFGTADAAFAEGEPGAESSSVSTAAVPGAVAGAATGVSNASVDTASASGDSSGATSGAGSASSATAAGNGTAAGAEGGSTASGAKDANGNSASAKEADGKDERDGDSKDKDKPTSSAFTFAGTGTTVDNATSGDGVEFFTIKTDDDKVYYLVVDRNSGTDNVYLLNTVTGGDLEALAENGKINLGKPAATQPAEEKEEKPAKEEPERQGVPEWLAYLLVVAVVGGGAFAYYQLKVKPEREESKVDEREVRTFEADGIYPPTSFDQNGSWSR